MGLPADAKVGGKVVKQRVTEHLVGGREYFKKEKEERGGWGGGGGGGKRRGGGWERGLRGVEGKSLVHHVGNHKGKTRGKHR